MAAKRLPIARHTSSAVLFASDYTCCVCRDRGRPVQIHHIDEDPANNAEANLAVLCLLCHNDTQVEGGFGRKLYADLVIKYRDDWARRVSLRRDEADKLAALRMAGAEPRIPTTEEEAEALMVPADQALVAYVQSLPQALARGYAIAQARWASPVTMEMVQGTYDLIDLVVQILVHLASWFPADHFDGRPAAEYFSHLVSTRFVWHRALAEPDGVSTGGTIVGPSSAQAVLSDLEKAVDDIVTALLRGREGFSLKDWRRQWENAKE